MSKFWRRALAALALSCVASVCAAQTTSYTYDALGRLIRAVETDGRAVSYKYDAAGNRIALGAGALDGEILVSGFTASSNAGGFSGLTTRDGLRDQVFSNKTSSHVTASEAQAWIQADLGVRQTIDHVDLAAPDAAVVIGGPAVLSGAVVERSDDASAWTLVATLGTVQPGVYATVNFGGQQARYVRVRRNGGQVGVGDFRLYSSAAPPNRSPATISDQYPLLKNQRGVFDPRANDSDPDGDALSLTAAGVGALHGKVTFTPTSVTYVPDLDYVGADSFAYSVIDTHGATANGAITVNVQDIANRAPVVQAFGGATEPGVASTFSVVASDADNDTVRITNIYPLTGGGTFTLLGGLSFRYAPYPEFVGNQEFSVFVGDGRGLETGARGSILVQNLLSGDHAPVAVDDVITVTHGASLTYDPRGNDTDADHDPLIIVSAQNPSTLGASVTVSPNGTSVTYVAPSGSATRDQFQYAVSDSRGGTSTATITVNLTTATDTPPTAISDSWQTSQGTTVTGDPRLNDTDLDGDALTVVAVDQPAHGSTSIALGKWIAYTPNGDYVSAPNEPDTFSYTISDGRGGVASGAISVTVKAGNNQPPVARAQVYNIPAGQSFTFDATDGAVDAEHDPLMVASADLDGTDPTYPVRGTLSRSATGPTNDELFSKLLTYTPPAGQSNFTVKGLYVLSDGHGLTGNNANGFSPPTSITLNVGDFPAPAPLAQSARLNVAYAGQGSTNLQALGSYNSLEIVSQPTNGFASINGAVATYRAPPGFSGKAPFTFRARGAVGAGAEATVDVTVGPNNGQTPSTGSNRPPVAGVEDLVEVTAGVARTIPVLANDTDPDGDPLTITAIPTPPAHGQAQIVGSTIVYAPANGFTGIDAFNYEVSDGRGGVAYSPVAVRVEAAGNHPPVAASDIFTVVSGQTVVLDLMSNDYDPDGDAIRLISVGGPVRGRTGLIPGNTTQVTYTAPSHYSGLDSFNYFIADPSGVGTQGWVSVMVLPPPNHAPTAVGDSFNVTQGQARSLALLANDTDPDADDILTLSAVTRPAHGSAVIVDNQVIYAPTSGYTGPDGFDYTMSDGRGANASASVNLTVQATNQTPMAANDSVTVPYNTATVLDVLANDSDPDNDTLIVSTASTPAHGIMALAGGRLTYTPATGYEGPDSFTYANSDGRGASASASVSVTVGPRPNLAPVLADVSVTTPFQTAKTFDVLANDSDLDGDTLTLSSLGAPAHGAAVIASGRVTYTPAAGYSGADRFTYTVSDGHGATTTANVNVVVDPPELIPIAFTASSNFAGYSGLTAPNGMRDGAFGVSNTIHATNPDQPSWIAADLGTIATVNFVKLAPMELSAGDFFFISGAQVQYSTDNVHWTTATTVPNVAYGAYANVSLGGVAARYVRLYRPSSGIAVGDFMVFGTPAPNQPPVAVNDTAATSLNIAVTIPVLANDTDSTNDQLTLTATSGAAHGATAIVGDKIVYTPTSGYVGADSFSYTISDGRGGTASATVAVNVASELIPIAFTASSSLGPDYTGLTKPNAMRDGRFLDRDTIFPTASETGAWIKADLGSIALVSTVKVAPIDADTGWGAVYLNSSAVQYSTDGVTWSTVATISNAVEGAYVAIQLNGVPARYIRLLKPYQNLGIGDFRIFGTPAPNQPPVAVNDTATTSLGISIAIPVLANDTDSTGDALTITSVTAPTRGTSTIVGDKILYTPMSGYLGADSFSYAISDGRGGTASATVSVAVTGELIPVAFTASSNAGDFTGLTTPNGMRDGRFGDDATIYMTSYLSNSWIKADLGAIATVGGVKLAPIDEARLPGATDYLNRVAVQYSTDDVNWTTVGTVSNASPGVYSALNLAGVSARYLRVEASGYVALGDFRVFGAYQYDRPPTAVADAVATTLNTPVDIDVRANDADPDGDALTISAASTPSHGAIVIAAGQITYTPASGYVGVDTFTYTVSDGRGQTDSAGVTVTIVAANQPPVAVNDVLSTAFSTAKTLAVLTNDTDADGDVLTITAVSQPTHGSVVVAAAGQITYTPVTGYAGSDSFTYTISDGKHGVATATVNVTVRSATAGPELIPIRFEPSSTYPDSTFYGLSGNGMRDGRFHDYNTIFATDADGIGWLTADLGATYTIVSLQLAPADTSSPGGWGPAYLNGTQVSYSVDGIHWKMGPLISGAQQGAYVSIPLGSAPARYIQLTQGGYLALGDFRIYGDN